MPLVRSQLRPLSRSALGLLLITPVALYIGASILKYAAGIPVLYDGLGFLADPRQHSWYDRVAPFLFLGGPLAAALLSLGAIVTLDVRRKDDQLVTTITITPRFLNLAVALLSLLLLAILAGYVLAENFGPA
jgi:hypothetical protein